MPSTIAMAIHAESAETKGSHRTARIRPTRAIAIGTTYKMRLCLTSAITRSPGTSLRATIRCPNQPLIRHQKRRTRPSSAIRSSQRTDRLANPARTSRGVRMATHAPLEQLGEERDERLETVGHSRERAADSVGRTARSRQQVIRREGDGQDGQHLLHHLDVLSGFRITCRPFWFYPTRDDLSPRHAALAQGAARISS